MPYDIIFKNGFIVDTDEDAVYVGDIGILNGVIATIGVIDDDAERIIDISGKYLAAGFIDSHVHIESSMVLPSQFGRAVLPHGTTSVIADPHEIVNVAGADGLREFLKLAEQAPVDIYTVVPSSVPATEFDTNGAGEFAAKDMIPFLDDPKVVGLGEVMCYNDVLDGKRHILDKIKLFKDHSVGGYHQTSDGCGTAMSGCGMTIDGHSAGLNAKDIAAYVSSGIMNDHECVSWEDALLRYNCGMNIYIREGSSARNLESIVTGALKDHADMSRFAFCTDDKHLWTVAEEGHISYNVRKAVSLGMTLWDASRLASANPARYYGLKNKGRIKEGFTADIVVLSDEKASSVDYVVKEGRLAAVDGKLILNAENNDINHEIIKNTLVYKELTPNDFALPEKEKHYAVGLNKNQLLTTKIELTCDEAKRVPLLAVVERYGKNGNVSVCHIEGYGIKDGAVATSVSHDSHNVVVCGDNAGDMALAANELRRMGGGYVIASNGKISGALPLPVYGLMSDKSADVVEKELQKLEKIARKLGVPDGIDPFTTLSFVALPVIPEIRLLDTGLFDVIEGKMIRV